MKKRKTAILAFSLLTLTALGATTLASCSCGENNQVTNVVVQGVKNGRIGDKIQLEAMVIGDSTNAVTWSSSNETVATVDQNGLVSLLSKGTVEIVATSVLNNSISSSPAHITVISEGELRLEIQSLPTKVKYKIGDTISYDGLAVMGFTYVNGVKDTNSATIFDKNTLTFSKPEGTKLTDADKGSAIITVSVEGYASASFNITIGDTIVDKKLYISKLPNATTYVLSASKDSEEKTATFVSTGLQVQELTYEDNRLKSKKTLSSNDYTLSLPNGSILTREGTQTITVTSKASDVESTTFNIMVYTEDLSVYNIIKTLQETKNYTAEVFNNVGTTADNNGFHYLRRYNEKYYDEIEYQNTRNGTEVVFDTTTMKSHIGYTTYKSETENGIVQYKYDEKGDVVADTVVSTGYTSWRDKASSVARLFTLFDLKLIPTETLNGRFLTVVINNVENDDDTGKLTLEKYPLVADFLDYCGWSGSLITIMNRFTIEFNEDGNLEMTADFGGYGSTRLVISDIGTTTVEDVEYALTDYPELLIPEKTVKENVNTVAQAFKNNNYTRFEYDNKIGFNKDVVYAYYNSDYFYSVYDDIGYAKINGNKVQAFTSGEDKATFTPTGEAVDLGSTDFISYVNTQVNSGSTQVKGYIASSMSKTFGDSSNPSGLLYTFSEYTGLSTDTMVTYQSFDDTALQELVKYTGSGSVQDYRFWLMTTYKTYVDDETSYTDISNIDTIEVWDINAVTLSGFVMGFGEFGTTKVNWIESGIATLNGSQTSAVALALI